MPKPHAPRKPRAPAPRPSGEGAAPSTRTHLPPDARRRQLLDEAARILTEQGVEQLQITEVATRAGVSRPLVYRLFPTRRDLVRGVLEDFAALIHRSFSEALVRKLPSTVERITTAFVEASCDAIEERGAGPWRLLDARGLDPELSGLARGIFARLLDPWEHQLESFLHTPPRRAKTLLWVIVAAGRAALDGWIDGALTRAEAVHAATTAISALLVAFAAPEKEAEAPTARPRRRARS